MISKPKGYLAIGLLTFLVALVFYFPAGLALKPLNQAKLGVRFEQVNGSVWHGQSLVYLHQKLLAHCQWQLTAWQLFTAKIAGNISCQSNQLALTGDWKIGFTRWQVNNLQGYASIDEFNHVLQKFGAKASGQLHIQDLALDIEKAQAIHQASGSIRWQNANLKLSQTRPTLDIAIDQIEASLSNTPETLALTALASGYPAPFFKGGFNIDGWASLQVLANSYDIFGLSSMINRPKGPILFEIEQKLY